MAKQIKWIIGGAAALLVLMAAGIGLFLKHGTIEAKGFCDLCHTQYYDPSEYAFNEKGGIPKPSGVLTGCPECHPEPYLEFKQSVHFDTSKEELRPGCSNCHEPHSAFLWLKYMFYEPAAWLKVQVSLHDDITWEKEVRPDLALKARKMFIENRASACKGCHLGNKNFREDIKAHAKELADKGGVDKVVCVKCHFNLVHASVPWPDKEKMVD